MNLAKETEKLRSELVKCINNSGIPITVKRYLINDLKTELDMRYREQLNEKEGEPSNE